MNIEERVNEIVYRVLKKNGITREMINAEKLVVDDLNADSLDVIEMMLEFQDKFDISISEEDISEIRSIGDIYTRITDHLEAEKA